MLDQEHTVARDARIHKSPLIDGADVPEARDEQAALHALDELLERRRGARTLQPESPRKRRGLHALLVGPETIVGEVFEHAILDPDRTPHGVSFARERRRQEIGILRIGNDRHTLIDDLLSDPIAAATLGEEAPSLVGGSRIEREGEQAEQIAGCGRLEHNRVFARIERRGVVCPVRFAHRARGEQRRSCRAGPIVMRRSRPSRTLPVGRAHRQGMHNGRGRMIPKQACRIRHGAGARDAMDEPRGHEPGAPRGAGCGAHRIGAARRIEIGRRFGKRGHLGVHLRRQQRHQLRVFRGELCQPLACLHRTREPGIVEQVRTDTRDAFAEP